MNAPSLLDSADSLTVYSIDGNDYEPGKEPKSEEKFYDYPVLGKVEVTEPSKRQELIDALKAGITDHNKGIKCFWPRHGSRRSGQPVGRFRHLFSLPQCIRVFLFR